MGDAGLPLNAWYGLSRLGRPEAAATLDRVLDRAGGDVPADMVVGAALKNKNPALLPALRKAYERETVSKAMKVNILRTLAKAETGEFDGFLREVESDANAEEELRNAAQSSLEGN